MVAGMLSQAKIVSETSSIFMAFPDFCFEKLATNAWQ
jgi:hypothetical protein